MTVTSSPALSAAATSLDRRKRILRTAMGSLIAAALDDPDVIAVMLTPDGVQRMLARRYTVTSLCSEPSCQKPANASKVYWRQWWPGRPSLYANTRSRYHPSAAVRGRRYQQRQDHPGQRVAGAKVAASGERMQVLEDTVELQCPAHDHVAMRTKPGVA